jgi:hypothetical protein
MSSETAHRRVHVMVPTELLNTLDATVGQRRRSRFIVEAIATELWRRRLRAALKEMEGSLADVDIPGWETRESAAAWVRALRSGTLGVQSSETGAVEQSSSAGSVTVPDSSPCLAELMDIAAQLSEQQLAALVESARREQARDRATGPQPDA